MKAIIRKLLEAIATPKRTIRIINIKWEEQVFAAFKKYKVKYTKVIKTNKGYVNGYWLRKKLVAEWFKTGYTLNIHKY